MDRTSVGWLWRASVRVAVAALVGVAFHAAWVALFILSVSHGASGVLRAILWLLAPVVTAVGFAVGLILMQRKLPQSTTGFGRAFAAALAGCGVGAVIGSPIGPMFAGLGVLGGGTAAVAVWVAGQEWRSAP